MMAMEAWRPKTVAETAEYVRVSMHEKVTLYLWKNPNKEGVMTTNVYFYGPNHAKRAEVYATLTGGTLRPGNPSKQREHDTATNVVVPRS